MTGSDFPEGDDWWKASDGRWYPPPVTDDGKPPTDRPETTATSTAPTSGGSGCLWIFLAIVVISVVAGVMSGDDDGGGGGATSPGSMELDARQVCHGFIKDRLQAPSTADFEERSAATITVSGQDYTVRGTVDAENGFGANLRSNYTCTVRASGDRWLLQSITGIS